MNNNLIVKILIISITCLNSSRATLFNNFPRKIVELITDDSLINAARQGRSTSVKIFLLLGSDVNIYDEARNTPLIWAAKEGYLDIIRILIKSHADINVIDKFGWNALMYATYFNRFSIIDELIKSGSDLTLTHKGTNSLIDAARYSHDINYRDMLIERINILIDLDANQERVSLLNKDLLTFMCIRFINQYRYKHLVGFINNYHDIVSHNNYPLYSINRFIKDWQEGILDSDKARSLLSDSPIQNIYKHAYKSVCNYNLKEFKKIIFKWAYLTAELQRKIPGPLASRIASY